MNLDEPVENLNIPIQYSMWVATYDKIIDEDIADRLLNGTDLNSSLYEQASRLRKNISRIITSFPIQTKVTILGMMGTSNDDDMYISLRDYIVPTINKELN